MGDNFKVVVCGPYGGEMVVGLGDTEEQFKKTTVGQLKEKLSQTKVYKCFLPPLLFQDRYLGDDDRLLVDYGVEHMSVFHMHNLRGGGLPEQGDAGMGDKGGKNRSKEELCDF